LLQSENIKRRERKYFRIVRMNKLVRSFYSCPASVKRQTHTGTIWQGWLKDSLDLSPSFFFSFSQMHTNTHSTLSLLSTHHLSLPHPFVFLPPSLTHSLTLSFSSSHSFKPTHTHILSLSLSLSRISLFQPHIISLFLCYMAFSLLISSMTCYKNCWIKKKKKYIIQVLLTPWKYYHNHFLRPAATFLVLLFSNQFLMIGNLLKQN